MNNNYSFSQIAGEALRAWVDSDRFGQIEEKRMLTKCEQAEQGIAAIKLIVYGSVLSGLAFDHLGKAIFTRR